MVQTLIHSTSEHRVARPFLAAGRGSTRCPQNLLVGMLCPHAVITSSRSVEVMPSGIQGELYGKKSVAV